MLLLGACGLILLSTPHPSFGQSFNSGQSLRPGQGFVKEPYLQNVSQTSIRVMWQAPLRYPGTLILETTPPRVFESQAERVHEVTIDKLEAGKGYRFRVESGEQVHHGEFATAPIAGSPFSFAVFGDSRSNARAHTRVIERIRQEVPDFLLGTGDIVNKGSVASDWDTLFEIEGPLLSQCVFYPSLGNHDRQGPGRAASNYRTYFSVPENSPDPERYYAFSYSNARFLVLDSNTSSFALSDQSAWIEEQLQAARLDKKIRHIFITMHHPPFSISMHGGQSELREAWTPLFEKYEVDAVFSGHDHVYTRANKNGVHYFVSGGGGAPLYGRKKNAKKIDKDAVQFFERVNHHLRVLVVGSWVEISAVRADGTIIETIGFGAGPGASPPGAIARLAQVGDAPSPMPASGFSHKSAVGPSVSESIPDTPQPVQGLGIWAWLGMVLSLSAGGIALWSWRHR